MKWIKTQELISILRRFPDTEIEVSLRLNYNLVSTYWWKYSTNKQCLVRITNSYNDYYTEKTVTNRYGDCFWKVTPFFFLQSNEEKQLAIRFFEELNSLGLIEDIISAYDINSLRICEQCHRPMNEGWLINDIETFCSDHCLNCAHPEIDLDTLKALAAEDGSLGYWTKWEE